MFKRRTVRFAAGDCTALYSSVWRMIVNKHDDIYLGCSKEHMGRFKFSLHQSGIWVLATTQASGATFADGNRRAKRWLRPMEHSKGVTRGPSIFVPHTSLGSRPVPPDENDLRDVTWYRAPRVNETVEFSFYLVEQGARTRWDSGETVLADVPLASGGHVLVLGSVDESPEGFKSTCERLLRENVFGFNDPDDFLGGAFLWIGESRDSLKVPLIVDLPVPIRQS